MSGPARLPLTTRVLARLGRLVERCAAARDEVRAAVALRRLGACGPGCRINGRVDLFHPEMITFGENVHLGGGAFIKAGGGLRVGDHTHISRNLLLYTTNHRWEGDRLPYDEVQVPRPVEIGRCVWIGMNVCVSPGTRIGDGAVIGMGAVVAGDVPAGAVVVAPKAVPIRARDPEHYARLEDVGAYGGVSGRPYPPA